ncbi:PQQ-binding-like beta-propeller repeat protein [Robiginitalea sp. M366]|uniref:outer membrane protein assembly factor BamB family protein n=1 Tax=Robiginitalea aestuariiviva TaxID=3036903 RepID=UPI00240DD430|nr:PQQ-binding-like beta-propeller repeat protein [Robiginitalea aestuariiviva]MDG1571520.1 PQQ-binding-like beta-propeller repeat protein [Robiginitalea aestuariiviva]
MTPIRLSLLGLVVLCALSGCEPHSPARSSEEASFYTWSRYLGDAGRSHFSKLDAFTPENVSALEVAWTYELPDAGQMQMNPLVVDTLLFGVSAALRVFALDARTGRPVWVFGDSLKAWHSTSRGVSYWSDGEDHRIFYTRGESLWALNALTGKPVVSFGKGGQVDLRSGLPESARNQFVISNTPGTIFKNHIIMPLRVSEGPGAAPGDIMAFDVRTGALNWVFHTIPHPGETGYETWEDPETYRKGLVGAANNWAGMALDEGREILYVPTGSAAPDFYGGQRLGENLFANCLLALDANTGERLWHFQFTHHDLWDRDPPAPPNLLTVTRNGEEIPAVAQVTKQGYVYLFNRVTGEPLFEIEEVPVPPSTLEGEEAWPTQPLPVKPAPFARQVQDLTEADLSPYAPNPEEVLERFRAADRRQYAPPGLEPVLLLPGYDGAAEWGGAGADPENGILYVNSNEMAWFLQMSAPTIPENASAGEITYARNCAVCHQADRSGLPLSGYPSLLGLNRRKTIEEVHTLLQAGKGMMPGFPNLDPADKEALIAYLMEGTDKQEVGSAPSGVPQLPFEHKGYDKFLDANGLPAISPPWGTLHAIDLNQGEYLWSIPLGDTPALREQGHPPTGTENYGGPVVTENGLLFIAATKDGYFRAFNRHTGALLWEVALPAAAFATPALYEAGGKQFIALACGGEKLGTPAGNTIIAFHIPSP